MKTEETLDSLLAILRAETLRTLRGKAPVIATGDVEGDAIRAAVLTCTLLVRRWEERRDVGSDDITEKIQLRPSTPP